MGKIKKFVYFGCSAFLLFVISLLTFRQPLLTRLWDEDVRVLATVNNISSGEVEIQNIRNWQYELEKIVSKNYITATYLPEDIQGMWLYEQPLGPGGLVAHTFLVFEFPASYGQNRYLGISVETRRQKGEKYSLIGGLLKAFEVTHIWATEEDLVSRRVQFLNYPLNRYELNVPKEYMAKIFVKFLNETQKLAEKPRWYNTFTQNCTNALINYVNNISENAIPYHYSFVFTGKAASYLKSLGYIKGNVENINRSYLKNHALR